MDINAGGKLGGYVIRRLIHPGEITSLYWAERGNDGEPAAIRILNSMSFRGEFENEAQMLSGLEHPAVLRLYSYEVNDHRAYMVTEYVESVRLLDHLAEMIAPEWRDAVCYTMQMLWALDAVHRRGILVRDLTPESFLLTTDGRIILRSLRHAVQEKMLQGDFVPHNPYYVSPEVIDGDRPDKDSDVYAVAVMLYLLATGRDPYRVFTSRLRSPRIYNPNIPQDLEKILLRALDPDSRKRYHSAAELLLALNQFCELHHIHFVDHAEQILQNAVRDARKPVQQEPPAAAEPVQPVQPEPPLPVPPVPERPTAQLPGEIAVQLTALREELAQLRREHETLAAAHEVLAEQYAALRRQMLAEKKLLSCYPLNDEERRRLAEML